MKCSSEPPTAALFFVGEIETSRLKFSSDIKNFDRDPGPPILAFLEKARVFPQRSKGFSLRGTPKILGKERKKRTKKQGKSENEKSKEIEKKQGLEGQGD